MAACTSQTAIDDPVAADQGNIGGVEAETDPPSQTGSSTTDADAGAGGDTVVARPRPIGERFGSCRQIGVESTGRIGRADLTETSGLAASIIQPGALWAVNDSGNAAGVHAMTSGADGDGTIGEDLGFYALTDPAGLPVSTVDVEDLAIRDGVLYVADIGDNNGVRDSVTIHLVDEPTVPVKPVDGGAGDGAGVSEPGTAVVQQSVVIRYPTEPVDAEGFLVDPITGQLIILDKGLADSATQIYTVDPPFTTDGSMEAAAAGSFDVGVLATVSTELTPPALLFPGAVTAADITTDGSLIAIRTYGTVWLFPRGADETVADALTGQPCEGGTAREGQGESLAFVGAGADGDDSVVRYVTVSEGEFRPITTVTVKGTS